MLARSTSARSTRAATVVMPASFACAAVMPTAATSGSQNTTRGTARYKHLQVRFRDEEFDDLAAYADQRGLPVSTVVRMLVLQAIAPADDLKAALDRLESDLAAVRRKALSA